MGPNRRFCRADTPVANSDVQRRSTSLTSRETRMSSTAGHRLPPLEWLSPRGQVLVRTEQTPQWQSHCHVQMHPSNIPHPLYSARCQLHLHLKRRCNATLRGVSHTGVPQTTSSGVTEPILAGSHHPLRIQSPLCSSSVTGWFDLATRPSSLDATLAAHFTMPTLYSSQRLVSWVSNLCQRHS